MKVLAYDIASHTGWCFGAIDEERPMFGAYEFPSTGENIGPFLDAAARQFAHDITTKQPELIVFEAPILASATMLITVRKLTGLTGVLEMLCFQRNIRCREIGNHEIKKFLTGAGNAKKPEVMFAVSTFGFDVKGDDNKADAVACWIVAQHRVDKEGMRAALRRWDVGHGMFVK